MVVVVVAVVVGIFFAFGLNFSNLDFSFSTALCAKILLSLSLLPLLFFNRGLNRGFSVSVSSFSSFVNFWPFRSLNKSAKERGLNVVVVVVRFVGSVLILNKLNLVVDSVVVEGVDLSLLLMIAQGSKADCNLSN